jgi:Fe-S-cluster-containing dehydrogenase component
LKTVYRISVDKGRCVLCRYCEVVCSVALKGEFDPDASVIKEIKLEGSLDAISCSPPEGCRGAPQCVKACDVRALTYAEEGVGD